MGKQRAVKLGSIAGRTKPKTDEEFSNEIQKELELSRINKARQESLEDFAKNHFDKSKPIENQYRVYSEQDYKHKVTLSVFSFYFSVKWSN